MTTLRNTAQRKEDVLAALAKNADAWLATASQSAQPHLIAVSTWWDGRQIVIATLGGNLTARNLDSTKLARLALGAPDDVILIDVRLAGSVPVDGGATDPEFTAGFAAAVGWNPAEEGEGWKLYRLEPIQIQAYRGYGETEGRAVMRSSRWLA
jgi:hypothetical protein